MNWYYVQQGQQAGPVSEQQLDDMVRSGQIAADTLVWQEGMAEWTTYTRARGGEPAVAPAGVAVAAPAPEAVCAECGRSVPLDETISHGNVRICASCKPIFLQKLREGASISTGQLNYAGFWIRVGAKFVDWLIVGLPVMVLAIVVGVSQIRAGPQAQPNLLVTLLEFGFFFLQLAYQVFFLGKYGATPGKMACKLRVVTADGGRVSYLRALGRCFAEGLSGMICYIGYIMVGFDSQKRALHDHICNTRVIYVNRG